MATNFKFYPVEKVSSKEYINNLKEIIDAEKLVFEMMQKEVFNLVKEFDNKIFNVKFERALKDIFLEKYIDRTKAKIYAYISTEYSYDNKKTLRISYDYKWVQNKNVTWTLDLVIENKRLNAEKTLNAEKLEKEWQYKFNGIKEKENAIKEYNTMLEKANKLQEMICDFLNNTNYAFRDNINFNHLYALK